MAIPKFFELSQIVIKNNDQYKKLVQENHETKINAKLALELYEKKQTQDNLEYLLEFQNKEEKSRHELWQFQHDYATEIQIYILNNFLELKSEDVIILDLVPSTVYKRISASAQMTIQAIHKLK